MSYKLKNMECELLEPVNIPVPNLLAELWTVPDGSYVRPIILSTRRAFTGTYDLFYVTKPLPASHYCVIDATMTKPTNYTLYLGHLDMWWKPGWRWLVNCWNVTAAGPLHPMVVYEHKLLTDVEKDEPIVDTPEAPAMDEVEEPERKVCKWGPFTW